MTDTQHFADIIKNIKFAMLTSIDANSGEMKSRPMTLQEAEFDGDLWFFASRSSAPVRDISLNTKVNLAFVNPDSNAYLSASGDAEVIEDRGKAEELWNPALKAWFPKGLEDPDLCLIKVHVNSADYWDTPSSKVTQLVGFAKAVITGKRASEELGRREHIDINRH